MGSEKFHKTIKETGYPRAQGKATTSPNDKPDHQTKPYSKPRRLPVVGGNPTK